jgi:hypothetical protein
LGRFLRADPALQRLLAQSRARAGPLPLPAPLSPPARPHLSGPPSPKFPLLRARVSSPVEFPPLSRPRVDSSTPQCRHLCARVLEPSRHRSCRVALSRRCPPALHLAVAAPPGCRCHSLDEEVLVQHAPIGLAATVERAPSRPLPTAAVERA